MKKTGKMKQTLAFSVLLHACFFTVALLWSAQFFEGSGGKAGANVLFVRLLEEKRGKAGEQTVIRKAPVSEKAASSLTYEKKPVRISHDPALPVEDPAGDVSQASEQPEFTPLESDKKISGGADTSFGIFKEEASAVHGRHKGHDSYNDAILRPNRYDDAYGTDSTGGSVPADAIQTIRKAIERSKTYPLAARRRGAEGVVHVGFSITPEGKPHQVRIVRSSGSRLLDRATIETVKRASPYPYVNAPLEIPVIYRLEE